MEIENAHSVLTRAVVHMDEVADSSVAVLRGSKHHVEGEKVEGPVISEHDAASRPGAVVVHSQIAVTALLAVVGSHGLEAVLAKLAGFFIRLNWVQPDHIFLDDGPLDGVARNRHSLVIGNNIHNVREVHQCHGQIVLEHLVFHVFVQPKCFEDDAIGWHEHREKDDEPAGRVESASFSLVVHELLVIRRLDLLIFFLLSFLDLLLLPELDVDDLLLALLLHSLC